MPADALQLLAALECVGGARRVAVPHHEQAACVANEQQLGPVRVFTHALHCTGVQLVVLGAAGKGQIG